VWRGRRFYSAVVGMAAAFVSYKYRRYHSLDLGSEFYFNYPFDSQVNQGIKIVK
jgi:hypothetical protein